MILVDDRAGSKELAPLMRGRCEISRLEYADFAFTGNGGDGPVMVGVERKTIMDLVNSMVSGRLSGHQLIGLLDQYDVVYLLVEGLWRPGREGLLERWVRGGWRVLSLGRRRFMAKEVYNYLNTLTVVCGLHVWRTDNPGSTARWLVDTEAWWRKEWTKHTSHVQFVQAGAGVRANIGLRKPSTVHRVVKELDGVGWEKGKAVAERYGSVAELVMAGEKDITEVPGIGKVLAERITKQLWGKE